MKSKVQRLSAREVRALVDGTDEVAVLDVREEGVFARGHLFHAANLPLSRLELALERLLPRRSVPLVLIDDDESLAERAAARLRSLGYADCVLLAGGVSAWRSAGYELFSGINVPSKAFGEFVEHHEGTPSLAPEELKRRMDAGEDMVILDSRPMTEYQVMNIPGAHDCPGAELVYRVHEAVRSDSTLVVVNCAGRTRSIIGAQSLINAGIANPVVALRNGTMGWHLAGFALEHGNARMAAAPGAEALARARASAEQVARRFGVRTIGWAELEAFRSERDARSLYCYDVRDPSEYAAGHLPGFHNAPGGQLVQATDAYIAVRRPRVVLADTDGVRATMTASWLRQLGFDDVYVLADIDTSRHVARETAAPVPGLPADIERVTPRDLARSIEGGGVAVIDLATSLQYRKQHIRGASWAIRARLAASLPRLDRLQALVFTAPDERLALLAAADARALTPVPVRVLDGGTAAWVSANLPCEAGDERMLDATEDVYYRPYDNKAGIEAAMRDYLSWEVALVEQIAREGIRYPEFPARA